MRASYVTLTVVFAGIHANAGTPNNDPRLIISFRVSGIGDTPNSMPARHCLAVPWRLPSAMVLFPDATPGEILAAPPIAEE